MKSKHNKNQMTFRPGPGKDYSFPKAGLAAASCVENLSDLG